MERRITLAACSSGLAKWMVAVRDSMNQEDRMGADILRLIRERNVRRERVREAELGAAVGQAVLNSVQRRMIVLF